MYKLVNIDNMRKSLVESLQYSLNKTFLVLFYEYFSRKILIHLLISRLLSTNSIFRSLSKRTMNRNQVSFFFVHKNMCENVHQFMCNSL